jgi:hypothetical protein
VEEVEVEVEVEVDVEDDCLTGVDVVGETPVVFMLICFPAPVPASVSPCPPTLTARDTFASPKPTFCLIMA